MTMWTAVLLACAACFLLKLAGHVMPASIVSGPMTSRVTTLLPVALLAALIFDRGLDALGDTIVEVGAADPNARLNIIAANGSRLLGTTWGDTLSILRRDDGVVLASEPYDDDPRWEEVPDRHLVDVSGSSVELIALKGSS